MLFFFIVVLLNVSVSRALPSKNSLDFRGTKTKAFLDAAFDARFAQRRHTAGTVNRGPAGNVQSALGVWRTTYLHTDGGFAEHLPLLCVLNAACSFGVYACLRAS